MMLSRSTAWQDGEPESDPQRSTSLVNLGHLPTHETATAAASSSAAQPKLLAAPESLPLQGASLHTPSLHVILDLIPFLI
jgi:hypothetical protein